MSVGRCICPVAQREEAALRFQVLGQSSYAISQLGKQASGGMSFKGKHVFRSPLKQAEHTRPICPPCRTFWGQTLAGCKHTASIPASCNRLVHGRAHQSKDTCSQGFGSHTPSASSAPGTKVPTLKVWGSHKGEVTAGTHCPPAPDPGCQSEPLVVLNTSCS